MPDTPEITPETRIARAPTAVESEPDAEGLVVLDTVTGDFHGLNGSATDMWQVLASPLTLADLARGLVETFGISEARATADARAFVDEMLAAGLLVLDTDRDARR